MRPSNDLSMPRITSALQRILSSIRLSVPFLGGHSVNFNQIKDGGLMSFIPVSAVGINELRDRCMKAAALEINSVIESYILTDLIPFLLTQSPGDLRVLSQKYALEVRFNSEETYLGSRCSFKFTIALCSKSPHIAGVKPLLSIPCSDILASLFPIPTLLSSSGESQDQKRVGEIVSESSSRPSE